MSVPAWRDPGKPDEGMGTSREHLPPSKIAVAILLVAAACVALDAAVWLLTGPIVALLIAVPLLIVLAALVVAG